MCYGVILTFWLFTHFSSFGWFCLPTLSGPFWSGQRDSSGFWRRLVVKIWWANSGRLNIIFFFDVDGLRSSRLGSPVTNVRVQWCSCICRTWETGIPDSTWCPAFGLLWSWVEVALLWSREEPSHSLAPSLAHRQVRSPSGEHGCLPLCLLPHLIPFMTTGCDSP